MAKEVRQVRYYGNSAEDRKRNHPTTLTQDDMRYGTAFKNSSSPSAGITQLGIQTLPGVKFSINASPSPIVIGATGIYEIDVDGMTVIDNLLFDHNSLERINKNPSAYIIVDYIFENEGGN